ncbi:MAG: 1-deoxy-D-xylulose-5-phosphate reductoisomerase [Alphaproteobacteria bacterium]|nr:MAG: 1-deoxy-D-xylulose-5-phosphate reductoisomerase [Alphaproteobacteria bacterium]
MSSKKKITILGVTGSIGQSTMDVILSAPDMFDVQAVSAHKNVTRLAEAAIKLQAKQAIIADETQEPALRNLLKSHDIEVLAGAKAIEEAARTSVDLVMAAIMGFAGLRPILCALEQGTNVAIANKEPLVAAGALIMETARKNNAKILPVDSEHNAIFQVLEEHNRTSIDKIILTASGGPFLNWSVKDIAAATPEQAIAHPNWTMGKKISVDSATMMNKALEIIEAVHLFNMPPDMIDVLIHPQSTIHSMVSYIDGSILSQMGASDMRTPIAYALAWPQRMDSAGNKLDLKTLSELTFQQPDFEKFPALSYAYKCVKLGQGACITLNAANEVAVDQFLNGKIGFADIMKSVAYAVDEFYPEISTITLKTVEDIEELDNTVRQAVERYNQV